MTSWHSYPKVFSLGHHAVADLLLDEVVVQEKVDGSHFSFGIFNEPGHNEQVLKVRSKGAVMHPDAPEKMFVKAVESVRARVHVLVPGWTYRAEYLAKPKHNALAYDRVPAGHLTIFDINRGEEAYMDFEDVRDEAARLGFEAVPTIHCGRITTIPEFRAFLDRESFLGGQKIEGVVVKNYHRFGPDKKVLMGKFVSEAFKEVHTKAWGESNPTTKDILQRLIESVQTPARWAKAVQHLRERGALEGSPRDIGPLIKEAQGDILAECADDLKDALWEWARPHIVRGAVRGLPEWWKEELLKKQFEASAE